MLCFLRASETSMPNRSRGTGGVLYVTHCRFINVLLPSSFGFMYVPRYIPSDSRDSGISSGIRMSGKVASLSWSQGAR